VEKDAGKFFIKAKSLQWLLNLHNLMTMRSFRDLNIQVQKLERMSTDFGRKFPLSTTLSKDQVRKKRAYFQRLNLQSKKVDKLFIRFDVENALRVYPDASWEERKALPKTAQDLVNDINKHVHQITLDVRRLVPKQLTK